jgi:sulfatase maturation enzyme AslB (radical SAM superfamily)
MKSKINLSVNPSFYCNFRCDFCYLTPEQLADRKTISLERLEEMVDEVRAAYNIDHVDIYGGEVALLPAEYMLGLKQIFHTRGIRDLNIVTNLSAVNEITCDPDYTLGVSYDFEAREKHEHVFRNMALVNRPISVLILASPKVLAMNVDEMITALNCLPNVTSVEIKPYSDNQANQHRVTHTQFEEFVKRWVDSPVEMNFQFINQDALERVLDGKANSFSDDHVYITPAGRFAVLEFDLNDNEFFLEMDTVEDYIKWTEKERTRVLKNKFCGSCEFSGKCLSEHLREVKNLDNGCNGYYHLIKWYQKGIE